MDRQSDGQLPPKVLNGPAMQLAGASFADAHAESGLAQREGLAVVALKDFPLARWQAGHRGAHTRSEILRFVALRELVLLGSPVEPALDELIKRYGPVVGARLPLRRAARWRRRSARPSSSTRRTSSKTAPRIRKLAYPSKGTPRAGSKRSTASIRPM